MFSTITRLLVVLAFVGLSGCETFRGMGRDISSAGNAITGN